ncbi:LacI family transcriptional regulator [Catenovulum sp. 2E275]|uniref:LacI family DNA-binding transcriptional regulator n=1 Tax=Catenovulum sp. 2E275 TaxID=2980497 RepID=UPI0021CFD257|nr:LacI family DNA-binding transcriptional regulator [Catenovulum sp. 2E275]MCU4674129.1 LacI family transcriptional regulator [Catenovulum sp. 2E275]
MTLKEIAQRANVSVSTVSRVLNGTAKISQPVKTKILAIARETGYLDKIQQAGGLNQSAFSGKQILLVTPRDAVLNQSGSIISYTLVESLKSLCDEQNIQLVSFLTQNDQSSVQKLEQALTQQTFDGIIVVWADESDLLEKISQFQIPTVLINGEDRSMNVDSVGFSNRYGAMMAVDYLLNKGHQQIGLLSYKGRQTIYLRESGYRDGLYNAGQLLNPDFHIQCDNYSDLAAEQAVENWLNTHKTLPVTALFCVTDGLALGAISALQKHGINVPQDISVIGMDGIFSLDLIEPKLTTVKLPFDALPSEALRILEVQRTQSKTRSYHLHVELSCELLERDSVNNIE